MWVPEEMRTLYHAGLAHGANHLVTLVTEAMEILSAAGAADPAGTLRPLLTAALDNALEQGDAALTGPIVRGDLGTVRAHLEDITANAPQTLGSYVALARATLDRAVTDGRVVPIRAARIRDLLDAAVAGRDLREGPMTQPAPPRAHPRGARRTALRRPRRRPAGRFRADHGRPARGPREPAARRPRAGRRRPGRRVDLREPAAVRTHRGPRPLPAHPRRRPRGLRARGRRRGLRARRRGGLPRLAGPAAGDRRARARWPPCWRAGPGPATSAACSPWSPSCSAWSGPTSPSSARRTTSSWC